MMRMPIRNLTFPLIAGLALIAANRAAGESVPSPSPLPAMTWADLADLSDSAPLVIRAQLRRLTQVEPERARGARAGHGRFYIEAKTEALIAGPVVLGEALRFLADLPLDAKGKPPKLKKVGVILFARPVAGRPGELQLVSPDAMIGWDPVTDSRLRSILGELLGGNAAPRVTGAREAIFVPGNLAGEGETQLFLATRGGEPATVTVVHRPGESPRWSVSFSEAIDASGRPPPRETVAWYRLACFLPAALPASAHVSATASDREQAAEDYGLVKAQLGPCPRNRR
jgi:hypothetical protein